jgi:hypothetical protein
MAWHDPAWVSTFGAPWPSLARWIFRAERSDALTGALGNPICCSRSFRSMRVAEGGRRRCGEVSKPQLLLRVMDIADTATLRRAQGIDRARWGLHYVKCMADGSFDQRAGVVR